MWNSVGRVCVGWGSAHATTEPLPHDNQESKKQCEKARLPIYTSRTLPPAMTYLCDQKNKQKQNKNKNKIKKQTNKNLAGKLAGKA